MKNKVYLRSVLHWTPRILSILFTLFISIFALDVFGEYSFPELLVALFMHLIPSFILIALIIVSWKRVLIGGIGFIAIGILFTFFFNTYRHPITFIFISLPIFLIGGLFLLDYYITKKVRK